MGNRSLDTGGPAMNVTLDQWRERGGAVSVPDGRLFAVDMGGAGVDPGRPAVLVLHGYPTSSWDFADAAGILAAHRRVALFDFLGLGLSDKPPDAGYSIFEHADAAIAVAQAFGLTRVYLWAHDMGTSVATEWLARRERGLLPLEIAGVVLMSGGVYVDMSQPSAAQRILMSRAGNAFSRLASKRVFQSQIRRLFGRAPHPSVLDTMWTLLEREEGTRRMPALIRFMEERARFRRRWIGALERLDVPALIGWGGRDPVTPLATGERLARAIPGADLVTWDDLGHFPQIEDPARVAEAVEAFFRRIEASADSRLR